MKRAKSISIYIKSAVIVLSAGLILAFPKETTDSAVKSINVCLSSIIPSMFAFMAIASYIQSSGLYRVIFRPVLWIMRKLVKCDDTVLSVFLLSLFGGYPIGVKLLRELSAQNNNYPAIRQLCSDAACYCYCISPSFAIIMIGNGVFGNSLAGAIIYCSDVLACIIVAAVISRLYSYNTYFSQVNCEPFGITEAVNSASRSLFTICTVILAFNTLLTCISTSLSRFGIQIPQFLLGAFEISNLTAISQPDISLIPFVSGISSMGGVCVLIQCITIVNGMFPLKKFIFARLACSLLSSMISWFLLQFVDISVSVSTYSPQYIYEFSTNKVIVLILIAMCIIIFHKSDKFFRKV